MGAVLNHFTMSVKTISDCCDQMESCCFDDRSKAVCHQTILKKCAKDEKLGKTSEDDKCAGDKCCHTDQLIVDKCCGSEKVVVVECCGLDEECCGEESACCGVKEECCGGDEKHCGGGQKDNVDDYTTQGCCKDKQCCK